MSVSGVSGNSTASDASRLMRVLRSSTTEVEDGITANGSGEASSVDSAKISGRAEFMNKLQKLKETDPEKFKEVIQSVADKLSSAAESQTDEKTKKMLTSLAEKFSNVASGGDLSQLEPPKPPSLSGSGAKAYGATAQPGQDVMGQMMRPQGPPQGPPPETMESSQDSTSDTVMATETNSGSNLRDTLKGIFDELNDSLNAALSI